MFIKAFKTGDRPDMKRRKWSNARIISHLLSGPLVMGALAVLLAACGASQPTYKQISQDEAMQMVNYPPLRLTP